MEALAAFALENLKQLVVYHADLIDGANDELQQLINEFETMKAYLQDASKIQNKNEGFKISEKLIREAVWDVEDAIDDCVTDTTTKNKFAKLLEKNQLGKVVRSLRENKVRPLFDNNVIDLSRLSSTTGDTSQATRADRRRNKEPRQKNVVGFEDETETLIKFLNEEANEVEVISIIGMPGLGKTTVAWKIYQDARIKFEFPTLIWLFISQEFKKRDMLLTILKKFTQKDLSSKNDTELAKMVNENLMRGKFLIFMDDIWTTQVWNEIKEVLPMDNKKGKVLITSRHATVAVHANRFREPHRLRFLNKEESWELLQLEVYGNVDNVDEGFEQVGRKIAEQCRGLPLSIIVIGGILVDKSAPPGGSIALKEEWRKVSKSVDTYLDRENVLEEIISLSYTELPYDLRDCFLYLGMFPEDPEIPARKLTQLWIAEGFIQPKPRLRLEEVAQDNLNDLINRNLIMVHSTKPHGEVKTCRVHDTIRQFCKNEAAFMFQEILKNNGIFEPALKSIDKYRRLCVHSDVCDFLRHKPKLPKARTFLCFTKTPIILGTNDITKITDDFKLLRVLEASKLNFPRYPAKITKLLHLRYLTLSCKELKNLPKDIAILWNLQTLIVVTSSRTLKIEASLWKMMQLRHLKTKASIILMKDGAGEGGENLQTLSRLSPESCTEEVLNKAKNLNTLGIRGELSKFSKPLSQLKLLNKLKLVHDPLGASDKPLPGLPPHNSFPPHLRILILSGTNLEWHHMSTLGQLGALEILKLKDHAFTGKVWDAYNYCFFHLEFLYIEHADFEHWTTKPEVFPSLTSLVIKNCEFLQEVPFELKANLTLLSLERVTSYAVISAKKIEQVKTDRALQRGRRGGFKLQIAPGDQVHQ